LARCDCIAECSSPAERQRSGFTGGKVGDAIVGRVAEVQSTSDECLDFGLCGMCRSREFGEAVALFQLFVSVATKVNRSSLNECSIF